jgi:arginine-tRNA-protein transferase
MLGGWRRFGHTLFRPRCASCQACRSLRIDVAHFQPNRSQRRLKKANEGSLALHIGEPRLSWSRLDLYQRFHADRARTRGWNDREEDAQSYRDSFLRNPFPTEEWQYRLGGNLVGLGLVDALPIGLSAIYFVHDPEERRRGLGTWNILCLIEEAARRGLPHVYLGYWVAECASLSYKANFRPHQILGTDGQWRSPEPPGAGPAADEGGASGTGA